MYNQMLIWKVKQKRYVKAGFGIITWSILANKIVLHVTSVIVPLIKIGPSQARISSWLMIHHNTGFTATGRFICIPIPDRTYKYSKNYIRELSCFLPNFPLLLNPGTTPSRIVLYLIIKYQLPSTLKVRSG